MESTRLQFATISVVLSSILIAMAMLVDVDAIVAQQVVESLGWFLTSVGTGYLGTKAVEHGVKHLRKNDE